MEGDLNALRSDNADIVLPKSSPPLPFSSDSRVFLNLGIHDEWHRIAIIQTGGAFATVASKKRHAIVFFQYEVNA